eukprot:Awhi_evm1s6308
MSDGDMDLGAAPVSEPVVEVKTEMTRESALRDVLKQALVKGGLARGLREAVKSLDSNKRVAVLCVLASDCDEAGYTGLVEALCKREKIPLIRDVDKMTLGEWAGLCKINVDGDAVKVNKCSCAVVRVEGAPTQEAPSVAFDYLMSQVD